jgi:hypothetical protein
VRRKRFSVEQIVAVLTAIPALLRLAHSSRAPPGPARTTRKQDELSLPTPCAATRDGDASSTSRVRVIRRRGLV